MRIRSWLLAIGLCGLALVPPARGQSPDDVLASLWTTLCPGAAPGSELALRCGEIASGGPGSRDSSAAGNFLGEIPGQGRTATRDGTPDQEELRIGLGAGWSVFASADAGKLERRGGVNEASFDDDTWALSAGIDWTPRPGWRLGLALNHLREDLDFLGSDGSTRVDYTGAIVLGGWMPREQLSIDAYAGRLDGDYVLRRAIDYTLLSGTSVSALARGDASTRRDLAGVGLAWSQPRQAWEWQLSGGLDWQRVRIDTYTESGGAGLALRVPGREIVSRRVRIDLGLARTVSTRWGVWQPQARLGWRHEFANAARPLSVAFAGDANGTAITFDTDDPDVTWGEAGLGAVFVFTGGHSAFVEWRTRFGHAFLDEKMLAVGWRFELP